jgi:putative sugar O-methyltransferase
LRDLDSLYETDFISLTEAIRSVELVSGEFGEWEDIFNSEMSKGTRDFSQVLDDLIGVRGMDRPTAQEILSHLHFLSGQNNPYFSVRNIIEDFQRDDNLKLTDLGSVCDVAILLPSLRRVSKEFRVLEIGGGYGRLAEALFRNSGAKLRVDMVDVIPSSLALASSYLAQSGLSVSLVSDKESAVSDVSLRLPSGVETIPDGAVDLAINIESFQEMTQEWVDYWIQVINRKTKVGSIFYHSNAFKYKNFFKLSLEPKWSLVKTVDHPRNWTKDHRTEVWLRVS